MLEELNALLDRAASWEPAALADGESIVELHRCLARLEAIATRAAAAFDAGGEWDADGARSSAAWVSVSCRVPKAEASRRVHLGRALRHLPAAEKAWLTGDIGRAQVAALAGARTPATEDALARDEEMLVGQARTLRHDQFVRTLAYWSQHADPDGTEDTAGKQRDDRRFHLSQSFAGMWLGDLVLDPISGTVVANQLRRIEDELFAADWAEARERVGAGVQAADLVRTPAQRRADALVEMAVRAGTTPRDGRRPEPLFTVLVGYETFAGRICELANRTVVTPGSVARWLDGASIERIVFGGPSRVLDVGVTRRLFEGATRRAVQALYPECYQKFCDVPAERCDIDHIEPFAAGGLTVAKNGRPACPFHNRGRHRRRPTTGAAASRVSRGSRGAALSEQPVHGRGVGDDRRRTTARTSSDLAQVVEQAGRSDGDGEGCRCRERFLAGDDGRLLEAAVDQFEHRRGADHVVERAETHT